MRLRWVRLSSAVLAFTESAALLASAYAGRVSTQAACGGERPPPPPFEAIAADRFEITPVFRPFLDRLRLTSPTFMSQWRRLAAATDLRVRVLVDEHPRPSSSSWARTVLTHRNGLLVSAEIYLKPSLKTFELIAHEIEHIREQLDGVDLPAQAGTGAVWRGEDGAFETRRAIEAGRRVADEITISADPKGHGVDPLQRPGEHLTTAVQQDRNARPASRRAARVSGDGRYVVFISAARLVEEDRNQLADVYVLDLATGHCALESIGADGAASNGESVSPDISRDGRHVVFESAAGNLTGMQLLPGTFRVFLRDRAQGLTRLLSVTPTGAPANGSSGNPAISADGAAVAFDSTASDLTTDQALVPGVVGAYVIQLDSGQRTRLDGTKAEGLRGASSMTPSISGDGRFVAFVSKPACRQAPPCPANIYLRDLETALTKRITRGYGGGEPDGPSYHPAISGDGRLVAFVSEASNLTRTPMTHRAQIYLHDVASGVTELVSHTRSGRPGNGASLRPTLSYEGAKVAFQSLACDLECDGKCPGSRPDINLLWDVLVYDRGTGRIIRVSTDAGREWMDDSRAPSLDHSGRVLAFGSRHPIGPGDDGHDEDLYIHRWR